MILASGSPRRRYLLAELGIPFQVVPSGVDERAPRQGEDPASYVLTLARQKARDVAARCPDEIILAADTDVAVDGAILGKPLDHGDALRMLSLLRGREHAVTTAVVVQSGSHTYAGTVTSRVRMRSFSDDEARAYVASGEPMDKAGAYAVQEFGGSFVEEVTGCYNAVVGLPLCLTARLLREAGLSVALPEEARCAACSGDFVGQIEGHGRSR